MRLFTIKEPIFRILHYDKEIIFNNYSYTWIDGKFGTGYPNDAEGNPKLVCLGNPNSGKFGKTGLPNNVSLGFDCLILCSAGTIAEENSGPWYAPNWCSWKYFPGWLKSASPGKFLLNFFAGPNLYWLNVGWAGAGNGW